jgi:hypothetical protein
MKILLPLLLATTFLACTTTASTPPIPPPAAKTMKAFASEQELTKYVRELASKQRRRARGYGGGAVTADSTTYALEAPAPATTALPKPSVEESVTNTQHAGVDEGGIVKVHGDHLVILRRGRLFTVAIGDGALQPVSMIDAFGPDMNPARTWYDEMLVSGDNVVVIGYSYERGGTEVGLFNLDAQGKLSYRSTYHLRSNDYYSSRNYASRLIGNKLIFYSPYYSDFENPQTSYPAVRKWHKDATDKEFRPIVSATRIYRPETDLSATYSLALHTVTVCDLANQGFECQGTSVLGPTGHVFYVSPDSVYVWASAWDSYERRAQRAKSLLFRMPLDGSAPSALRTSGGPVDQFSFLQSDDQHLNVLVRSEAKGDGMWAAEVAEGDVALMRIPLASFSDGSETVPGSSYRPLPEPEGYNFQNRFVGNYLIYGTGSGGGDAEKTYKPKDLVLVEWARGVSHSLSLPHGVDRIEQMGSGAVIVGTDGTNLHFTSVRLQQGPQIASRYTRSAASQGELRSHGFFYKPDGDDTGMLGLPISMPGRAGYHHLFESSAAILFLRNDAMQLSVIGELNAQADKARDDGCRASCVDWYGNARPLFLRGRLFALLGYELVEGAVQEGQITELRRINYAP